MANLCNSVDGEDYDFTKDENGKEYFRKKTQVALAREDIDSDDIFQEQKRAVSKLQPNSEKFQCIKEKLEKLF